MELTKYIKLKFSELTFLMFLNTTILLTVVLRENILRGAFFSSLLVGVFVVFSVLAFIGLVRNMGRKEEG